MDLQILTYGSPGPLVSPDSGSVRIIPLSPDRLNGDPGHHALFVDLDVPGSERILEWARHIPRRPTVLLFGASSRARLAALMRENPEIEMIRREDQELLPLLWQRILDRIRTSIPADGRPAEAPLEREETRTLLDSLDDLVLAFDPAGRLQWAHHPASNHSVLPSDSLKRGMHFEAMGLPTELVTGIRAATGTLMTQGGVQSFDITIPTDTGERSFGCKASARHDPSGTFAGITVVGREITELVRTRSSLDKLTGDLEASFMRAFELAFTDRTTGLPNREAFLQTVELSIEQKSNVSIAIIYMHNMANIRHSVPFETGENIVKTAVERLTAATSRESFVARYGENEFAFLFQPAGTGGTDALEETAKMIQLLEVPVTTDVTTFSFTCSAGIARYPEDAADMEALVQSAEIALQEARDKDIDRIAVFSREHRERLQLRLQIENELARPDITDEMFPVFQPIVDAKTMKVEYFEVLLRWNSPRLGKLRPDLFIPIAEKNGVVIPITRWLLRKSCHVLKQIPAGIRFSINLSPVHLFVPDLVRDLLTILDEEQTSPERFKIEITEGIFIRDPVEATQRIISLKENGFSVALDDFGAGFSGLGYLGLLPVDTIKIDKSFLDKFPHDRRTAAVIGSILTLTRSLGINCIAEGVETQEQVDSLREVGCNLFQGFLIAKPLVEADMMTFLESDHTRTV